MFDYDLRLFFAFSYPPFIQSRSKEPDVAPVSDAKPSTSASTRLSTQAPIEMKAMNQPQTVPNTPLPYDTAPNTPLPTQHQVQAMPFPGQPVQPGMNVAGMPGAPGISCVGPAPPMQPGMAYAAGPAIMPGYPAAIPMHQMYSPPTAMPMNPMGMPGAMGTNPNQNGEIFAVHYKVVVVVAVGNIPFGNKPGSVITRREIAPNIHKQPKQRKKKSVKFARMLKM
ncbi:hypothetical protein ANCDUO_23272 [Ancylostoma duodenale]|uniref:Uncharacterized protein n=1 Tax=Ancylostoma duodenale TaxID=51022 RepID=A0A0C2BS42_9BILA|nr:hypothetical protein ANCDUO_23272 [Ancylostoma duodenale]